MEGYRPGVVERLGLGPDVVLRPQSGDRVRPDHGLRPDRPTGDLRRTRHQLRRPVRRPAHPRASGRTAPSGRELPRRLRRRRGARRVRHRLRPVRGGAPGAGRSSTCPWSTAPRCSPHECRVCVPPACSPTSPEPTTSTTARRSTTPTVAPTGGSWRWGRSKRTSTGPSSPVSAPTPTRGPTGTTKRTGRSCER